MRHARAAEGAHSRSAGPAEGRSVHPAPDIGSVDALKESLLGAESVVVNRASTGPATRRVFASVGIEATIP